LIWDFSLQSVRRLVRHFSFKILIELSSASRRTRINGSQYNNNHADAESTHNSDAENAHERKLSELYGAVPGGSARYRLLWQLASLNVAAKELQGDHRVYHYACDKEDAGGRIQICTSDASSERADTNYWVYAIFGLFEERVRNVPYELQGAEPGSDAHLKVLLSRAWGRCPRVGYRTRQPRPDLYSVFGERLVDEYLDPIRPFRDAWPALLRTWTTLMTAALDHIPAYSHLGRLEDDSCEDDEDDKDDEDLV
jgi:hypothetical protein